MTRTPSSGRLGRRTGRTPAGMDHPFHPPDYPLARPYRLSLEAVATRCGLHPDLVRRFVALSLVDAARDASGALWFPASAPAVLARVQRLRSGLNLNYAAVGLVMDLLDRIDVLEEALERAQASIRPADPPTPPPAGPPDGAPPARPASAGEASTGEAGAGGPSTGQPRSGRPWT